MSHAEPTLIVSASCGIEVNRVVPYKPLLDKAIELATVKPQHCIILQRPQERAPMVAGRDRDWGELMAGARAAACGPVPGTDPPYTPVPSGTAGPPQGAVRAQGGPAGGRQREATAPARDRARGCLTPPAYR